MDRIPSLVETLITALGGDHNKKVFENHKFLRIDRFVCRDQQILDLLKSITSLIQANNLGTGFLTGEIRRDLNLESIRVEEIGEDFLTWVINKSENRGFYYFLTVDGLVTAFSEAEFVLNARKVWVADSFKEFFSLTCNYLQWNSQTNIPDYKWQGLSDPRELVRDYSFGPTSNTPRDIRPWLLKPDQELVNSMVLNAWKFASAKNLSMTIPSEIRTSDEGRLACFRGERLREVKANVIEEKDLLNLFPILHECSDWIYLNREDAEIKHTLINYHLAFEWVGEEKWPNKLYLERSLQSARESYKLHLHQSSQDLLKAYGDIEKALHDEVDKVSENTRGLVTNFWRDFAIAAGVLVINFLTTENLSPQGIKVLYTAVSIFLLISLTVTLITNSRFNKIAQQNRNNWYKVLYPFIDSTNLDKLVNAPISQGLQTYFWVASITVILYLTMASYLIYLSFFI